MGYTTEKNVKSIEKMERDFEKQFEPVSQSDRLIGEFPFQPVEENDVPEISFKSRAIPDPDWQGWWQCISRGGQNGFNGGLFAAQQTNTSDVDCYIFIDITGPSITLSTLAGTTKQPRELTNLDGNVVKPTFVCLQPDELGRLDPEKNGLKLQPSVPGQPRLMVSYNTQDYKIFSLINNKASLFQKIPEPPVPVRQFNGSSDSIFPDVNNPVEIAKYVYECIEFNGSHPTNVNFKDLDYRSKPLRDEIMLKLFNEGITIETPIRRVRTSVLGQHSVGAGSSTDICTDIFTEGYSYCTAGSTVEISGFEGAYCSLNQTYVNGVSWLEEGAVPNPRRANLDVSEKREKLDTLLEALYPAKIKSKCKRKDCKRCKKCCRTTPEKIEKEGTWVNVYDHFLLRADTSDVKYPKDSLGWANFKGCPKVKVTHRFHPKMEYAEFRAAIGAAFYMLYQVSQHIAFNMYAPIGSIFGYTTWEEVKNAVKLPGTFVSRGFETRTSQSVPSGFYNDVTRAFRRAVTYNDPFGLNQFVAPPNPTPAVLPGQPGYYNFNIVMNNYIKEPKNLYWSIEGILNTPPIFPTQTLPVGYKPIKPAPHRAKFVGQLGNISMDSNGRPVPTNPDPVYATIIGQLVSPTAPRTATQLSITSNSYYVGKIDPSLTGNKNVGYVRLVDAFALDQNFLLLQSYFSPENAASLDSYATQSLNSVFSALMKYLVTTLDSDSIIFDIRTNGGGLIPSISAFLNFIGADRNNLDGTGDARKDTGYSNILNLANPPYLSVNDSINKTVGNYNIINVSETEMLFGSECIFKGSANRPKKVILLVDEASASAGDACQWFFFGSKLDGDLGSFTTSQLIGGNDGRLKGNASIFGPVVVSKENNYLVGPTGLPVTPIVFRYDNPGNVANNIETGLFWNQQNDLIAPYEAPTLKGTSGSKSLPNDWETLVYPDIGLTPFVNHSGLALPSPNYNNRNTWRDTWLEQAILAAL